MQRIIVHRLSVVLVAALTPYAAIVASAAGSPGATGKAAKRSAHHGAKHQPSAGVVFGGVTSAGWPVVIQVSGDGREVVRATMGLSMSCQPSGTAFDVADFYMHVPISATGAFQGAEEGSPTAIGNNQTATVTGQMTGKFNRAMTTATGTWRSVFVVHDATGATVDQCDSGTVSFVATQ